MVLFHPLGGAGRSFTFDAVGIDEVHKILNSGGIDQLGQPAWGR